ncbi:serine/threonine-protein kinase KIN82, partial [Biomphalaria glabrata]
MFRYLLCCITGQKQNTVKCVRDVSVIFPPVASTQVEQKDVFDENSVENNMFPWLTERFLSRTRFRAFTKEGDGDLCRAKSIYKFLAPFKSTEISQLYFAIMKEVNKYCNVKVYKFSGKEEHLLAVKEAMALDFVRDCPFIVHLIETFKTMGGHYLVTENFGFTTLHNLLKDTMFFNDFEVKFYASELVSAIEFLHKEGIIHRTLSAHTVGIKSSGHIKLFDLERSFCSLREDGSADPDPQTIGMFGLKAYMSPEMINFDKYNNKVDWWCLGVILYTLAHGKMPFQGQGRRGLMTAILEKDVAFDSGIHDEHTISFITKLLTKDPKKRLGDGEVKTHAFFEDIQWEKVEALGYDPPFPCPANAMHNMPADLCSSQTFIPKCDSVTEIIDDTTNMAKKYARQVSLYPMRQYDCELTSDWAAFMASPNLITSGIAYVKNYLQVPPPEPGRPLFIEDYTVVYPLRPATDPENPEKLSSKAPSEDNDDYTLTDASMTDRDTDN